MVIMVNYILRFNFVQKLQCFQGFWRPKKREKEKRRKSFGMKFGWNFFKEFLIFISFKISETRSTTIQSPLVTFEETFCPYVHVNITLKFYRTLRVHTEPFYILRYSHGTVEQ